MEAFILGLQICVLFLLLRIISLVQLSGKAPQTKTIVKTVTLYRVHPSVVTLSERELETVEVVPRKTITETLDEVYK